MIAFVRVYHRSTACLGTVAIVHLAQFLLPVIYSFFLYRVKSLLVAPTALTSKDDLADIDKDDGLQNDEDKVRSYGCQTLLQE